jgi:Fic family protein
MEQVHTFQISIDWSLISLISVIDRFDASWSSIERREGKTLKQLKSIATVRSVGASTRIEGSRMSDEEVDVLLKNLDVTKLEDRDSQEVVGYLNVLDLITEQFDEIGIRETDIKSLHNLLMKPSKKDEWHRGNYKQHTNSVEASMPDGSRQIIFQTTDPGFATEKAVEDLIKWYQEDSTTHALVKCALFAYEFLSIHPFQDGNGRLSRLLATLLLLKQGYTWIQYVSFEHEIESRKNEYYSILRRCQSQRPNEDVTPWVIFFFDALKNIQGQLLAKLRLQESTGKLSPKEKSILLFLGDHAGAKSGEISKKLDITIPTAKRILAGLVERQLIEKHGIGPGTYYTLL